nr:hypothetical protein [Kibdelosporangium sp. MJ126-NF4]CTQ89082.1 hypothetical protein [Kibdelosporangium sp. MJ126-NF4]
MPWPESILNEHRPGTVTTLTIDHECNTIALFALADQLRTGAWGISIRCPHGGR